MSTKPIARPKGRKANNGTKAPLPVATSALSMAARNLTNMAMVSAVSGTVLLGLLAARHF
jgi:hypothetical protein